MPLESLVPSACLQLIQSLFGFQTKAGLKWNSKYGENCWSRVRSNINQGRKGTKNYKKQTHPNSCGERGGALSEQLLPQCTVSRGDGHSGRVGGRGLGCGGGEVLSLCRPPSLSLGMGDGAACRTGASPTLPSWAVGAWSLWFCPHPRGLCVIQLLNLKSPFCCNQTYLLLRLIDILTFIFLTLVCSVGEEIGKRVSFEVARLSTLSGL